MHMFFLPRTSAASAACVLLVLFALAACGGRPPALSPASPSGQPIAALGAFSVTATGQDLLTPAFTHGGKDITPDFGPMRLVAAAPVAEEFPLPGCHSRTVELFTGGANCCFGYYLLAACPGADYAAYVEPGNGGIGGPSADLRAYPATDAAFFYYQPAGQTGKKPLFLSRAESPRLTRYILFADGLWRADTPGELRAVYEALLAETRSNGPTTPSAKAILLTYYTLMAGKNEATAARTLRAALPRQYRYLAPVVLADITAAIREFSPVTNIPLGR